MKLGTSTNLLFGRPDGSRFPLEKTLEMVSVAGFRSFDLNGYDWALPGSLFLEDDLWENWIDAVAQKAAVLKVTFHQCHGYFYPFLAPSLSEQERRRHEQLQQRSFACCAKLGAKVCVLHPETDWGGIASVKQSTCKNRVYFENAMEQLEHYGIRVAVENMCDYGIAPKRKFCAQPEELVDFVASFRDERIGICWDFEHGFIMEQNQPDALRHIGKHLYATHVSDTYSRTDNTKMHVLPITGGIRWEEIMPVLREIDYAGIFCFEVHNYANTLPDALLPTALQLAYEVGNYLINI